MSVLCSAHLNEVAEGDLVRGINHSRIITGPPVRVKAVRPIANGRLRVSYVLVGIWTCGWRDLPADRGVTIERKDA